MPDGRFQPFPRFGTLSAIMFAWLADGPGAASGRHKMTIASLSQIATSLVAALATATLFISAAVGPAAQII
jgi:hypothetical protein